jgi:hypothetical protein
MDKLIEFLTNNTEVANALSTIMSAIVAFIALIISFISLYVAHSTLKNQRRHNILSVKPLPEIMVADYEERLTVKIRNNGSGPLIVNGVRVEKDAQSKSALIDWMPALPEGIYWSAFIGPIRKRAVMPGNEIILLELRGDPNDSRFQHIRDRCRATLKSLNVVLEHTDIYNSQFEPREKSLSWFGRQLHDE